MKHLLILLIRIYWILIPASKRKKCIFRTSCSKTVYSKTLNEGFISGLKTLKYRVQNCRSGAFIIKDSITGNLQMILPNQEILDQHEISERFIK